MEEKEQNRLFREPMTPEDQERISLIAGTAFTPGAAVKDRDVFAGRKKQLRQVIDAINQEGKSVLVYGERGVGKTSLANVIDEYLQSVQNVRLFAPHIACDSDDDFNSIWQKVIEEKDRKKKQSGISDQVLGEIDSIIEDAGGDFKPHTIRCIADAVAPTHLMIPIIDEFDRVDDDFTVRLITDTIKSLSDHVTNTTVILVGVGDTVDELISEHESIERALEQVPMPRMSTGESWEILSNGTRLTGVHFSEAATSLIVAITQGLPHYTHLLGLESLRVAVDDNRWMVCEEDVETATKNAVASSQQSMQKAYHSATSSPRPDNLFRQVLLACALAPTDSLGYFAAADVRQPMTQIMGRPYDVPNYSQHLKQFCEEDGGKVLERTGGKRKWRFRFKNPLFQPFVILHGIKDGFIGKEDVRGLFRIAPDHSSS